MRMSVRCFAFVFTKEHNVFPCNDADSTVETLQNFRTAIEQDSLYIIWRMLRAMESRRKLEINN